MTRAGIAKAVGAVRKVDGAHETIADDVGRFTQASAVCRVDGELIVGDDAKDLASQGHTPVRFAKKYMGTDERGASAVPKLHFPGLHPDAARWLVANRPIRAIGIDTASIDYGQSTLYESHRALFANEIPAFENLTSLERLPTRGATVIALPMKIGGGSGAPLRAIAIVP